TIAAFSLVMASTKSLQPTTEDSSRWIGTWIACAEVLRNHESMSQLLIHSRRCFRSCSREMDSLSPANRWCISRSLAESLLEVTLSPRLRASQQCTPMLPLSRTWETWPAESGPSHVPI